MNIGRGELASVSQVPQYIHEAAWVFLAFATQYLLLLFENREQSLLLSTYSLETSARL
jgi:hypothetical protein